MLKITPIFHCLFMILSFRVVRVGLLLSLHSFWMCFRMFVVHWILEVGAGTMSTDLRPQGEKWLGVI